MPATALLDPDLIKRLEQLEFAVRRLRAGRMKGERLSKRRGTGSEFADYRDYAQGDDPRFIDWNVFGRLDRLFLKLFHEEEDLRLAIHVDASLSMSYGDPEKLLYAKRLAASLAYIALCNLDQVTIHAGSAGRSEHLRPARGKRHVRRILEFLEPLEAGGGTDLQAGLKEFALRNRAPGMKIVLSDFLDKAGTEGALKWLVRGEDRVVLVQVLSPQEVRPDIVGDLALEDCEDGFLTDVSITSGLLKRYDRTLKGLVAGLRDYARARGMAYHFVQTSTPMERILLQSLRAAGVLR